MGLYYNPPQPVQIPPPWAPIPANPPNPPIVGPNQLKGYGWAPITWPAQAPETFPLIYLFILTKAPDQSPIRVWQPVSWAAQQATINAWQPQQPANPPLIGTEDWNVTWPQPTWGTQVLPNFTFNVPAYVPFRALQPGWVSTDWGTQRAFPVPAAPQPANPPVIGPNLFPIGVWAPVKWEKQLVIIPYAQFYVRQAGQQGLPREIGIGLTFIRLGGKIV